jgi:hypothetical protein
MQPNFRMLSLIPAGLAAECIVDSGDAIEVTARAEARVVRCPFCGSPSRIHSRNVRKVSDLLLWARAHSRCRASLSLRGQELPKTHLRGAFRRCCPSSDGAPDNPPGMHRPPSRPGAGRPAGRDLRQAPDAAGQQ